MTRSALLLCLVLLLQPWVLLALHEDQVGMYDWYKQQIGHVNHAAFLTGQRKRVMVSTESNVLATLALRSGEIGWRRVLGPTDSIHTIKLLGRYVISVSGSTSATVRAWAVTDGTLVWEASMASSSASPDKHVLVAAEVEILESSKGPSTNDRLAVLCQWASASLESHAGREAAAAAVVGSDAVTASVHVLASANGEGKWSSSLQLQSPRFLQVVESAVTVVGISSSGTFSAVSLDPSTGTLSQQASPPSDSPPLTVTSLAVTPGTAFALDKAAGTVAAAVVQSPSSIRFTAAALDSLLTDLPAGAELTPARFLPSKIPGAACLLAGGKLVLVSANGKGEGVQVAVLGALKGEGTAVCSEGIVLEDRRGGGGEEGGKGDDEGESRSVYVAVASSGGELRTADKQVVRLQVYRFKKGASAKAPELVHEEEVLLPGHRGLPERLFLNAYARSGASEAELGYGFRLLIAGEDHSLTLSQQGEVVWQREESLASIAGTLLIDLPEEQGLSVAAVEHSLEEWLHGHWLRAKFTIGIASTEEAAAVQKLRLLSPDKVKPFRDRNGFRKLLFVATAPGTLFALHSGDGRILWATRLKPAPSTSSSSSSSSSLSSALAITPAHVTLWREPHWTLPASDRSPEVLLVSRVGGGGDSKGYLAVVQGHTGEVLSEKLLGFFPRLVLPLPVVDSHDRKLLLLVEQVEGDRKEKESIKGGNSEPTYRLHLLPNTAEARSLLEGVKEKVTFHVEDKERNSVSGYALKSTGRCVIKESEAAGEGGRRLLAGVGESGDECGGMEVEEVWRLPLVNEHLVASAAPNHKEARHTQVRVLGDRTAQFKLLSKNVLFLATSSHLSPGTSEAAAGSSPTADEAWLAVHLIDAVSGHVIDRVVHKGASGPVHAVMAENWVVYHFFNLASHRFEMAVLEALDHSLDSLPPADAISYGIGLPVSSNLTAPLSSWSLPGEKISVIGQSYYFPYALNTMAVTATALGITNKHVLLGTALDQVLAVDRRLLDPRRSLQPSQADKEAGIMPYSDTIPVMPQAYLTHKHKVEGLKAIISEPSRLESTTLVFAYGIDLFFVRTAPSRVFDSLTEDFSFALLLGTVVVLVVGIVVAWWIAGRQELRRKWK